MCATNGEKYKASLDKFSSPHRIMSSNSRFPRHIFFLQNYDKECIGYCLKKFINLFSIFYNINLFYVPISLIRYYNCKVSTFQKG